MPLRASRLTLAALAAAALAASACGAASKGTASRPATAHSRPAAPQPTEAQVAQRHVAAMVLAAGSLPGYTLHSKGSETLKDQLPPKGTQDVAEITRLVKANWLASEHSFTVAPDGKLYVMSDVNLFRSGAAAARINGLEHQRVASLHTQFLPTPPGAPAGSHLELARGKKLSAYALGWTQGPVMAFVTIYGHRHEVLTRVQERRVAAFLAVAANAQAARIAHVEALGSTPA